MQKQITQSIKKFQFDSLYENIRRLENTENLIILDFYHLNLNLDKNSENEELFLIKHIETLKEITMLDKMINYIIFCKASMKEKFFDSEREITKANSKINSILEFLNKSENIFIEEKLSNIHFLVGFSLAKNITTFIFTDNININSNWLKIPDSPFQNKLKFSEFEFMRITLSYMLKEKKKKYEEIHGKQPSKLSNLFDEKQKANLINQIEVNKSKSLINQDIDLTNTPQFQNVLRSATNYVINSQPKNFQTIRNILNNFAEQNIHCFKSFNLTNYHQLSFLILSELINKNTIKNYILADLIKEKKISTFDQIEELINFEINKEISEYININHIDDKSIENKKRKREKKVTNDDFSISETSEEEYKKLIFECPAICNYTKKIIFKVLSNISFESINRLPTNPSKYKNLIYSYVNNQELLKISKKILNLDYQKVVNILTDGIIIEFMRNNLIVFLSDKKIYYNIQEIEKEKFRFMPQSANNI